ncbi:MAG: M48 family metalloprotease [Victivallales bacterium]|nr:M48 family metalloprotease [Victivallales bacterium]
MNFWTRQALARKRSKAFFVCFLLAMVISALVPYLLFQASWIFYTKTFIAPEVSAKILMIEALRFWGNPSFYISMSLSAVPIIGGAALQTSRLFPDSGGTVAMMLNGTQSFSGACDFFQQRLHNIVEEISIASGVPIPRIFILEQETGINALVAGSSSQNAVLCVTRGACELLTRDELQGVIAHEYSHLLNGDMPFHTFMLGLMHGYFISMETSSRLDITTGAHGKVLQDLLTLLLQIIALLLLLPVWLWLYGKIFGTTGRIIKSAFSRSREYLADACAVQFTRYPRGLADAMKKVGSMPRAQILRRSGCLELSHFFFSDATPPPLMFSLYPSHPPLKKRIKALDPQFDGTYPEIDRRKLRNEIFSLRDKIANPEVVSGEGFLIACAAGRSQRFMSMLERFGTFDKNDIEQVEKIIGNIPKELYRMTQSPDTARPLVYALLTDKASLQMRNVQANLLSDNIGAKQLQACAKAFKLLEKQQYMAMLLVELSIPALRTLTPKEYEAFRATCRLMALADNKLTIFEYALLTCISVILDPLFGLSEKPAKRLRTTQSLSRELSLLFSAMAWCGATSENDAADAFKQGLEKLPWENIDLELMPAASFDPEEMTKAIKTLCSQTHQRKKHIIDACSTIIGADSLITNSEWELLRAFAMMLECPMPILPPEESRK